MATAKKASAATTAQAPALPGTTPAKGQRTLTIAQAIKQYPNSPILQPTPGVTAKGRGARGAYIARAQACAGYPLAVFVASCKASVPSTPQSGKLAGKPEPVKGWVRWLTKTSGFFMLVQQGNNG